MRNKYIVNKQKSNRNQVENKFNTAVMSLLLREQRGHRLLNENVIGGGFICLLH